MSSMGKTFVFLLVLVFLTASCVIGAKPASGDSAAEDSWSAVAFLPANATGGEAAALSGKIYFFGGASEQYDPQSDSWTQIAPPPVYNGMSSVVACENKIYIIGGGSSLPTQVYDPSTNTWTKKAAIPADAPQITANVVDGKIYVIDGVEIGLGIMLPINQSFVYDPSSDSWSTLTPPPVPVLYYASAVLDDKIFVIGGGVTAGFSQNALTLVQIFDPKLNQWTNGTSIPTGVISAGACATSGVSAPKRIYVVGGALRYGAWGIEVYSDDRRTAINLTQVFDPATGKWFSAASLPDERKALSLVNVGDKLYAVGGLGSIEYSKVMLAIYEYTPIGYHPNTSPSPSPSITPTATPTPSSSPTPNVSAVNLFPIITTVIVAVVVVTIVMAGLVVYRKKFKRDTRQAKI